MSSLYLGDTLGWVPNMPPVASVISVARLDLKRRRLTPRSLIRRVRLSLTPCYPGPAAGLVTQLVQRHFWPCICSIPSMPRQHLNSVPASVLERAFPSLQGFEVPFAPVPRLVPTGLALYDPAGQ